MLHIINMILTVTQYAVRKAVVGRLPKQMLEIVFVHETERMVRSLSSG
jgi:hypothetical protein